MSAEFELHRFEAAPVSATVAVVELDGHFHGQPPARVRLLIERGGRGVEVPAITSGGASPWSATFAIALDDLADDATEFALAPGRGPLIGLPSPEAAGGPDADRYIRLARQANELRHRLGEATAAAGAVDTVRAELAESERRGEAEADRLRAELAAATARAEEAGKEAASAREARDEAVKARETAESEQSSLRDKLRETESRLTETERERASLRARAESADRTVAELSTRAEALEERAGDAEAKTVAAEDETRLARRDLRDTRARLEALLREQRHHGPERRGFEVPEPDDDDADAGPDAGGSPHADPSSGDAAPPQTEVLETRETASAGDRPDERASRTTATAIHATRVVRIADEHGEAELPPAARPPADRDKRHAPEDLDPGRIGARHIEPSSAHRPSVFTPARIMVGIALLLLIAALIAIVLGAGLV